MSSVEEWQQTPILRDFKENDLSSVELLIPLVDHSVTLGVNGIFDGIFANSRDLPIPTEDWTTEKPLKAVFNWSTCVQTACPCLTVGAVGLIRGVPEQLFHDDTGLSPIPGHGSSTREGLSCFALSSLAAFVAVFHLAVPHDHRGYEWQTWINFGIAFSLITNATQLSHTFAMFAFFSVGGGIFFGRGLFCISITVVPIGASPALLLF